MNTEEENQVWDKRAECDRYPGYYFYPRNELKEKLGLVELTFEERRDLYASPGLYTAFSQTADDIDFQCAMDNSRTPTHRAPSATPPNYGSGILFELMPKKEIPL